MSAVERSLFSESEIREVLRQFGCCYQMARDIEQVMIGYGVKRDVAHGAAGFAAAGAMGLPNPFVICDRKGA